MWFVCIVLLFSLFCHNEISELCIFSFFLFSLLLSLPHIHPQKGFTPLHVAAKYGQLESNQSSAAEESCAGCSRKGWWTNANIMHTSTSTNMPIYAWWFTFVYITQLGPVPKIWCGLKHFTSISCLFVWCPIVIMIQKSEKKNRALVKHLL